MSGREGPADGVTGLHHVALRAYGFGDRPTNHGELDLDELLPRRR